MFALQLFCKANARVQDPPATVRTGAEDDVEGHADQAGTNPRAGQVFNEPVGDRFEHGCAASRP